jgi:hypothetical protein
MAYYNHQQTRLQVKRRIPVFNVYTWRFLGKSMEKRKPFLVEFPFPPEAFAIIIGLDWPGYADDFCWPLSQRKNHYSGNRSSEDLGFVGTNRSD